MNSVLQEKQNIPSPIQRRSVPLYLCLSVLTCGLFFIYWYAKVSREVADITGEEVHRGGALTVFFHIITGGLFSAYWFYKVPHKLNELRASVGLKAPRLSKSLWLFGLWADGQILSVWIFISMLGDRDVASEFSALDLTTEKGVGEFVIMFFGLMVFSWCLSSVISLFFIVISALTFETKPQTTYALAAFYSAPLAVAFLQANLNNYLLYLERKQRGVFKEGESNG